MPAAPRPTPRRSHTVLFVLILLVFSLLLACGALVYLTMNLWRERAHLRQVLKPRWGGVTLTDINYNQPPERIAYLHECYDDPSIDPSKVVWNLLCRPTPFVDYAPEPGVQQGATINSDQIRGAREIAKPKPAGVYRIFVTGGSFAYGFGASNEAATIPARLELELNQRHWMPGKQVEVWNAAVCGWTSTHERLWIETHLLDLEPDMILQITGINDGHWGSELQTVFEARPHESQLYYDLIQTAMRMGGVKPYDAPPKQTKRPGPDLVAANFMRNAALLANLLAAHKVAHVVAVQPNLHPRNKAITKGEADWLKVYETTDKPEYINQVLDRIAEQLAAPTEALALPPGTPKLAQLRTVYADRTDSIYIDTYHVGDKGNRLAAARLADELQRLFPSPPAPTVQ